MMTVRKLDPVTGDIVTSGDQFITGREEIAQTIQTRLRLFTGEYFRNILEGTPWFDFILTKRGTATSKDAILKNRIIRTPGVLQLTAYNATFDVDARRYSISASVLTEDGLLPIERAEDIITHVPWILETGVLDPDGIVYTHRTIEV